MSLSVQEIRLDLVDVGDNPRSDPGDLEELAASITRRGVMEPVRVRPAGDRFQLIFGQRRVLASRLAGRNTIPAIVADDDPENDVVDALVENIQRADLNPIDEARAIQRLVEAGHTEADVALLLGRSHSHVNNRLRLLRCDPFVVEAVRAGAPQVFHGILLAALPHRQQQVLAKRSIQEGWSQFRLEAAIRPERASRPTKRDVAHPAVDSPADAGDYIAGLVKLTPKVPEALARLLLWSLVEMDVFIQGRFEKRHPMGYSTENRSWLLTSHLEGRALADELAQVLGEVIAEYGQASVKAAVPTKGAA